MKQKNIQKMTKKPKSGQIDKKTNWGCHTQFKLKAFCQVNLMTN